MQYELEMEQIRDEVSLSVLEELQIINRIMNRLHDGHTCVYAECEDARYINDYTELWEYGTPIKINGEPTKDILDRFLDLFQYEREEYAVRLFEDSIIISEQDMKLLGIDKSGDPLTPDILCDPAEAMDKAYEIIRESTSE